MTTTVVIHTLHVATDNGFDWGTVAAIAAAAATVVLALFTWGLARQTKRLAAGAADDLSAEWRPVLMLAADVSGLNVRMYGHQTTAEATLVFTNGGRGPALNILAYCDSITSVDELSDEDLKELGTLPVNAERTLLASGLHFRDASGNEESLLTYRIEFTYMDLANAEYLTVLKFEADDPNGHHPPPTEGQLATFTVPLRSMEVTAVNDKTFGTVRRWDQGRVAVEHRRVLWPHEFHVGRWTFMWRRRRSKDQPEDGYDPPQRYDPPQSQPLLLDGPPPSADDAGGPSPPDSA